MENDKTNNLFEILRKSLPGRCSSYGLQDYEAYIYHAMEKEEKMAFESHARHCRFCREGLLMAREEDGRDDDTLSEAFLGECLKTMQEEMARLLTADAREKEIHLLAASSKPESAAKTDLIGIANGLAVDTEVSKGFLIECVATVSPNEVERGSLTFNAEQIMGVKTDDRQYEVSPPFQFLETKLKEFFLNSHLLAPYRLNRREILVELELRRGEAYFKEAKSLALSVIIAILAAVTGRSLDDRSIAFSSRVRQDGFLQPVDDIPLKLHGAKKEGVREVVLSDANRSDCPEEYFRDDSLKILFFPHIGDVFRYLDLIPEPVQGDPFAVTPVAERERREPPLIEGWRSVPRSEGWRFVVDFAAKKGIDGNAIVRVLDMVEDLSQIRRELRPICTAFVIGDPEKIDSLLPPSEINLTLPLVMVENLRHLSMLAPFVDGHTMGFVVDRNGCAYAIRKLNVTLEGDSRFSTLLSEPDLRFAVISGVTESLIFYLTPGGNRVHVFGNGDLMCKYLNGKWQKNDLDEFESRLSSVAEQKDYTLEAVLKIGKTAIRMADLNLGALFVVYDGNTDIRGKYSDRLGRLGVDVTERPIQSMTVDELINFAKEDGALIIDDTGSLRSIMAYLKPGTTKKLDFEPGIGARHLSAQRFSSEVACLTVVVSEDGGVTAYCDGEKIYRI